MSSYTDTMLKLERMTQSTNAQQMAWQEKMSGQSHQLEVSDLVKAGLNPVLSAGGSGAQSYTTSLESGANAIANTYAAKESAGATRYAARQSAAATRAAAYANLEAARLGYDAQKYSADQHYAGVKYQVDNAKTGSWAGLFDNYTKTTKVDNEGLLKNLRSDYKDIAKNPQKFVKSSVKDGKVKNIFDLTLAGRNTIQKTLRQLDMKVTLPNQNIVFNAIFRGDKKSIKTLQSWIASAQRKQNSAIRRINSRNYMI